MVKPCLPITCSLDQQMRKLLILTLSGTWCGAPGFMADPEIDGTRQHNFAVINFTDKMIIIGGTGYTGEIKKGIFFSIELCFTA